MRGRKRGFLLADCLFHQGIKKESPNEGTETIVRIPLFRMNQNQIKKESPNEGTETVLYNVLL